MSKIRQPFQQFRRSIFGRLLFVILFAGLLVNTIVAIYHRRVFNKVARATIQKNIFHYADYIIKEIGVPPDTTLARKIAEEYSIQIRYEGTDFVWASSDKIPPIDNIKSFRRSHRKHSPRWSCGVIQNACCEAV